MSDKYGASATDTCRGVHDTCFIENDNRFIR